MSVITCDGLTIETTYCKHLINNRHFDTGEIFITEYNIDQVLNLTYDFLNDDNNYYPKESFSIMLRHMAITIHKLSSIILDDHGYYIKTIFCFSLGQNTTYKDPFKYQAMHKNLEIVLDGDETSFDMVLNKLEDIVNDMDDRGFPIIKELNEGVRLTVIRIERLKENENIKDINKNKTFKPNNCIICLDNVPNVIYCNCGHMHQM